MESGAEDPAGRRFGHGVLRPSNPSVWLRRGPVDRVGADCRRRRRGHAAQCRCRAASPAGGDVRVDRHPAARARDRGRVRVAGARRIAATAALPHRTYSRPAPCRPCVDTMIPLVDLKAQYRALRPEIDAAVSRVLENGQFVLGPAVEAFEREFAAYTGAREAVAVNSGTSALHVALIAAGVGSGDEVITVPFTFVATVAAIEYTGATPVLVDIDPDYYTMDPAALARAVTPRTKAIMPVHLFGQPADMDPILDVARRHRLVVIEDAAQAHGAEDKGRRVGSIGDIGCFSFYPGKNLGAYGEGGAAVTNNPQYAETMRLLRCWGEKTRYEHAIKGFNYRMEGMQGAVLGVKLRHIEQWTEARRTR